MTSDVHTDTVVLVDAARAVRSRAYVPYSRFRAGAAVRTDDGSIVPGVIVENVSLGLAMCAERVALHATVAQGHRPVALALVAPGTAGKLTWPCGACLQVALELGGPGLAIAVAPAASDDSGSIVTATVGELIPNGPHKR